MTKGLPIPIGLGLPFMKWTLCSLGHVWELGYCATLTAAHITALGLCLFHDVIRRAAYATERYNVGPMVTCVSLWRESRR